jgi:hypothetical protein
VNDFWKDAHLKVLVKGKAVDLHSAILVVTVTMYPMNASRIAGFLPYRSVQEPRNIVTKMGGMDWAVKDTKLMLAIVF